MKWTTEEYDRLLAQLTDNAEQLAQDGLDHERFESFRKHEVDWEKGVEETNVFRPLFASREEVRQLLTALVGGPS